MQLPSSLNTSLPGQETAVDPAKPGANARLNEAAEAFEGAFLKILLKSMRSTIPEGGLFERQQMEQYEEMRDSALAESLAGRSATGIAQMVVRQLGGEPMSAPLKSTALTTQPVGFTTQSRTTEQTSAAPKTGADQQTRQRFVQNLLPAARQAARALGIEPAVIVAQAALETGWGQHIPKDSQAVSSNNLFGIKAGSGWQGQVTNSETSEFLGGKMHRVVDRFRAYANAADSVADYVNLISQSPRYKAATRATSAGDYLDALQRGGYATDPRYAEKIESILDTKELRALR